ncbi:MAG: hypothetical protein JKY27_11430 [Magnetovibrio sp.]|nr:hypothetical protein [Magnetovibrio sp.]
MLATQVGSAKPKPQSAQNYQTQTADIQRRQDADAKKRQDALARASAQHRARFAAQGISPADGSSAAILEGLQKKTTQQLDDKAVGYNAERARAQTTFADVQAAQLEQRTSRSDLLSNNDVLQQFKNWW